MSRSVSQVFRQAAFSEETDEVIIVLLTIMHGGITQPIRLSSDPTQRLDEPVEEVVYGTVSRGEQYIYYPFQIDLPSDEAEAAPRARISVDNVRREITQAIRSITTPPTVTIEIVLASQPDVVEAVFPSFDLAEVTYDALTVSGTLTLDSLAGEPYPAGRYDPARFPGLFGA